MQQSVACAGLCKWVIAIEKYDKVIKEVEPKRQKLREAEAQLGVVMSALRAKQAELKQVMDKLASLDADLQVGCGSRFEGRYSRVLLLWCPDA